MIKRTWKATGEERARWKRQKSICASSELNSYELRGQGCELSCREAAPTLCCCLQHSSGFQSQHGAALFTQPCIPGAGSRARAAGTFPAMLPVRCGSTDPAPAAAVLTRGTEKKNLPFQLLHYRGWRPGGRVSLYWLLLGREKKSGPQLPRRVEAKALSSVTDLSSFNESPLLAINSSPGNPCLHL